MPSCLLVLGPDDDILDVEAGATVADHSGHTDDLIAEKGAGGEEGVLQPLLVRN